MPGMARWGFFLFIVSHIVSLIIVDDIQQKIFKKYLEKKL